MLIRYIGDGKKFIHGYPACRDKTFEVKDEVGKKLISSGLYEEVKEETENINESWTPPKTRRKRKSGGIKEKTEDVNETNQFGQGDE